jgi:hypothetical protein
MLCTQIPQLTPESQDFYETWLKKQYGQEPDQLQMLDQIPDLDQRLLDFVAPAYSDKGAPARGVVRLLRALLVLFVKGLRSDNFLVHDELKSHVLSRWFVRLEHDEVINDSFRIALLRLRQRLARRLGPEQWHDFLKQTVTLAQRHYRPPSKPATRTVCQATVQSGEQHRRDPAASPPASETPAAAVPPKPDPAQITFDLTTIKARARLLEGRDIPKRKERLTTQEQKKDGPTRGQKKRSPPPKRKRDLPRSAGDQDAYWITKKRRGLGKVTEVTLGYETGFFATRTGGLITEVVVREAAQANKTEFNNWIDRYEKQWQIGPGQLEVSAECEFFSGPILRHSEQNERKLYVPPTDFRPTNGKLDARYFTYVPEEDLFVCHEGAELRRTTYEPKEHRTRYLAPREACAHCPTADLCQGGRGPRTIQRSDFADEIARAKERAQTEEYQQARRAQRITAEGSFAHSNCQHGLDHARYYGQQQMRLQGYWTAAAMNLKKACRWMQARLRRRPTQPATLAPS